MEKFFEDAASRSVRLDLERASKRGKTFDLLVWDQDQVADDMRADFGTKFQRLSTINGVNIRLISNIDHPVRTPQSKQIVLSELFMMLGAEEASDKGRSARGSAVCPRQKIDQRNF
jgi:hypothetical protein